jgi:universal stress protein E
MRLRKILVATDFSTAADLAVRRAAALAERHKAELRLMHAVPPQRWLEGLLPSRQHWTEHVRARAASALQAQATRLAADRRIEVDSALVNGKASGAIAAVATDFQPDLVVVGARGEGPMPNTHAGLGRTAQKLMGSTHTPLLLVRRADIDLPRQLLAALDLTPVSKRVVQWAACLAAADGELAVLHVFEEPFAHRLRSYGVSRKTIDVYAADQQAECERALRALLMDAGAGKRIRQSVLRGDAIKIIGTQLRKLKSDTLVIGKHGGRKRDAATPYGSACHDLSHFAPVDVLVVP